MRVVFMKEAKLGKTVQGCTHSRSAWKSLRCSAKVGASDRRPILRTTRPIGHGTFMCKATESPAAEAEAPSTSGSTAPQDLETLLQQAEQDYEDGTLDLQSLATQIQELASSQSSSASKTLQDTKTEAQNKYLRLSADFDNFRKRSAAERERQSDQVRGDVVKQLIPLVDSFDAAQAAVKDDSESKIAKAYQGLYKQMVEIFKSLGIEAVPGAGQPFDPEFHDAIMREENNEVPNNTVLQELRRGFRLGKTLLRPSMVKVSFSDEPASDAPQSSETAE